MSKEKGIDYSTKENIKASEEALTSTHITSINTTDNVNDDTLGFDVNMSELNPDANVYTTNTSLFDTSYPSLSSIIESAYPHYNYVGLSTNYTRKQ